MRLKQRLTFQSFRLACG